MNIIDKFDDWNKLKQEINFTDTKTFYIKERQVWYLHSGLNIWFESNWKWDDFKRPVLVIKKVWNMFFVVSMTTKWKDDNKFYYKLDNSYFDKESYLVLSQVKVVDKKRFFEHIETIKEDDFLKIKKELKKILF